MHMCGVTHVGALQDTKHATLHTHFPRQRPTALHQTSYKGIELKHTFFLTGCFLKHPGFKATAEWSDALRLSRQ